MIRFFIIIVFMCAFPINAYACTCYLPDKREAWKLLKGKDVAILELTNQDMLKSQENNSYEVRNIKTIRGNLPEILNVKKYSAAPGCTAHLPNHKFITTVEKDNNGNYSIIGCDISGALYRLDSAGNLINSEPSILEVYPWWFFYSGLVVMIISSMVIVRLRRVKNKEV